MITSYDEKFMKEALREARKAYRQDEVPVGAIVVDKITKKILSRGYNQPIKKLDPTAHAEIIAIREAAKKLKNYRLNNCSIYVTTEPCAMCFGAIVNARIKEIVFGAYDSKAAVTKNLNHKIKIHAGILEEKCKSIIQEFFKNKRKRCKFSQHSASPADESGGFPARKRHFFSKNFSKNVLNSGSKNDIIKSATF